jgi:hypothetical protein
MCLLTLKHANTSFHAQQVYVACSQLKFNWKKIRQSARVTLPGLGWLLGLEKAT